MNEAAQGRALVDGAAPGAWVNWAASLSAPLPGPAARAAPRPAPPPIDIPSPRDRDFIALMGAYRPHRGLARARTLEAVTGALPAGLLFGFVWHETLWIPMFQIGRAGLGVEAAPQAVLAEFASCLDGWELAHWFVTPSTWLDGLAPIDGLASRLPEVLAAARVDRFIARG